MKGLPVLGRDDVFDELRGLAVMRGQHGRRLVGVARQRRVQQLAVLVVDIALRPVGGRAGARRTAVALGLRIQLRGQIQQPVRAAGPDQRVVEIQVARFQQLFQFLVRRDGLAGCCAASVSA